MPMVPSDEIYAQIAPLRIVFDAFCAKHGYEYAYTGRYARIYVSKPGPVCRWFDLRMSFDANGSYRTIATSDVPYELHGGAFADILRDGARTYRYGDSFVIWAAMPFNSITELLLADTLEANVSRVEKMTTDYLEKTVTPRPTSSYIPLNLNSRKEDRRR